MEVFFSSRLDSSKALFDRAKEKHQELKKFSLPEFYSNSPGKGLWSVAVLNKMKLSAVVLLALPLQALAGTCYFCENTPHVGAVYPTYDCGKKCHKKNYNTYLSTYHCWMDGRNPTCFKNCCKRSGRQVGTITGL
ncbi:hypothetical protein MGYG_08370 [Nannizzia gypsea CBS 118893]|uniref:Uncharacterized protein n=1 Tax=Arthroderma gypseum (strain ATCC MYA-4604 / CBS 118893) TaxID=535722 RepID=E4V5I4_ARTGP|nr:hypothetical protein MGYG_08370 [Nannizzia gypsea CBS 118893]EFR05359.1 hypothetical protein MGYG_08370 [Nannizzia gypsea CBS 118893]